MITNQNRPAEDNDGVLPKLARRGHGLPTPPNWVVNIAIPDTADANGETITEVECDGLIYRSTLSDFKRHGFSVNREYRNHRALALACEHIRCKGKDPAPVQLGLCRGR